MKYSAVVVAAGSGRRMQLGYNKVYYRFADGETILEKVLHTFLEDEDCIQIVVVTDPYEYRKQIQGRMPGRITLCQGGDTRQQSVRNGLCAVIADVVMIHDGARPYVTQEQLDSLKQAMETEQAALLAVPCKDTIKKCVDGYIETTYDRNTLVAAQTPQVFQTSLLLRCTQQAILDGYVGTDDTSLVEKYGNVRIKVVEGSYANKKITTIEDLQ